MQILHNVPVISYTLLLFSSADSVFDTLAIAKDLRTKILRVMGDKLVNSLSVSHVDDVEKVKG